MNRNMMGDDRRDHLMQLLGYESALAFSFAQPIYYYITTALEYRSIYNAEGSYRSIIHSMLENQQRRISSWSIIS